MKLMLVFTAISLSLSAQADVRLCEKPDPFPLREDMKHLSDADYEYEKHINELKYDEINDITYQRYMEAIEYFDIDLAGKI